MARTGAKRLRGRIYGYGVAVLLLAVLVFLMIGTGNREQVSLAEEKVVSVQVWGVGLDGAMMPHDEALRFVRLVNLADHYREKTCCADEKAPASRALIHMAADDVAVSYWGPQQLTVTHQYGTYWVEQAELERYMQEMAEFR